MVVRVKSVIVGLTGGLGNQLFQYAAGRALSLRLDCHLQIEHSRFLEDRYYELDNFNIPDTIRAFADKQWLPRSFVSIVNRLAKKSLKKYKGLPVYREPFFGYDPLFEDISAPVFLDGYFQSEKYFKACEKEIRQDLALPDAYPVKCLPILDRIKKYDAIAIHVRRGDYVSVKENSKIYYSQPIEYYQNAITLLSTKVRNPRCFIFSDDLGWVKDNFLLDVPWELVDINSSKEVYWDLILMRQCKHFIIANSSLSWWGAWLGNDHHKIVIAPKNWFKSGDKNTDDLIPINWVKT